MRFKRSLALFLLLTFSMPFAVAQAQVIPIPGLTTSSSSKASDSEKKTSGAEEKSGEASSSSDPSTQTLSSEDARKALIEVLQDPKARDALIEVLKKDQSSSDQATSSDSDESSSSTDAKAADATEDNATSDDRASADSGESNPILAQQIGAFLENLTGDAWGIAEKVMSYGRGVELLASGDAQINWSRISDAAIKALLPVAAALLSYLFFRWVGTFFFRQTRNRIGQRFLWRLKFLIITTVFDVIALGLGLVGAILVLVVQQAKFGLSPTYLQGQAINLFLLTHAVILCIRFIFAPTRGNLRLFPIAEDSAKYWARQLTVVTLWIGYSLLLVISVFDRGMPPAVNSTFRFVIVLVAVAYVFRLVAHNRSAVKRGLFAYSETFATEVGTQALKTFARVWHLLAYAYLLLVFWIWLSQPAEAFHIVLKATGFSVLIIGIGVLLSLSVTRTIAGGVRLPDKVHETLPALQGRLNAFVPWFLKIFRFVILLVAVLMLLDVWGLFAFRDWLASAKGSLMVGRYFSAALVVLVSFGIWLAVMAWIDLRLREHSGYIVTARVRTLFQLFRNAFTVIIIVMAVLLGLSELGMDIGPLIAGAGVVGLAISFGAQTLVKDIITGAFIQIENAINEGDVVTVGGTTGVVERLTVRSVRLRDLDGTTHIVPFSSVDLVSNFMRDFAYHVAVVGISYDTDIKRAKAALVEAFSRLQASEFGTSIIDDLEMHGVVAFADSSVNIRVRIKTTPGDQWGTGRAYNEFVKEVFDEWGIEIPFPQVTYHDGSGKSEIPPAMRKKSKTHEDDEGGSEDVPNTKPEPDMPDSDE